MSWLFEPGFFSSAQVHTALIIGGVTAVVSASIGVFTVIRGQSFAGHALTDTAATGGSAAVLIGINPLVGFLAGSVLGAGAMEAVGVRHVRSRDLATGIVLGASIGLASLFLYLTTTTTATTGATQEILFGSIFVTTPSTVPVVIVFGVLAVLVVAAGFRPLLLTSIDPDLAAASGLRVGVVELAYMAALAFAVGLSSIAVGAILSTALLIGPAATALRLTKRIVAAVALAAGLGVATTWLGILVAYDSADWGAGHDTLPVSFCIVGLVFVLYLVSGLAFRVSEGARAARRSPSRPGAAPRMSSGSS